MSTRVSTPPISAGLDYPEFTAEQLWREHGHRRCQRVWGAGVGERGRGGYLGRLSDLNPGAELVGPALANAAATFL